MADNPLKKYFRQPKVYVDLPTHGIFSQPGTIIGDPESMPIFGMTGMDEILMKTPDALLNGEATVKVIESCCPSIKNAWGITILDLDLLLVAIRIATYGNTLSITHTCESCESINDYEIDLGNIVTHFKNCRYENSIPLKDLTVKLRPLTYKEWTEFQLRGFAIQRQIAQALTIEDKEEQDKLVKELFTQIAEIQRETLITQIDSVEVPEGVVDQKAFIVEWIANTEQLIFDKIKEAIDKNRTTWEIPKMATVCPECNAPGHAAINMDQASFFARA